MTESFADLFEFSQQSLAKLKPGAIVLGTVVEIRADVVVINAGLKSEGIIPIEQFKNDRGELEVALGDEVKVALDALEDGFGETRLSREKAKRALVWDELEEAHQNNATVVDRISGKADEKAAQATAAKPRALVAAKTCGFAPTAHPCADSYAAAGIC